MSPPFLRNLLFATAAFFLVLFGWTPRGQAIGDSGDRKIGGCPGSPNCVSSMSPDEDHWIAPLSFNTSADEALQCLEQIIRRMKRTTIVVTHKDYLHAEFRTLLGFVDDVEFQIDRGNRTVHMRSVSRTGYWDLGVNRRRLKAIRAAFNSKCK